MWASDGGWSRRGGGREFQVGTIPIGKARCRLEHAVRGISLDSWSWWGQTAELRDRVEWVLGIWAACGGIMQRSGEDRSRQWSLYGYVIAETARLKERLGGQVWSLIMCRARRCTLSSWASEVVDETIQTRGAYSRSGRTNPLYMISRCLGLSIGAAQRRRCRRLLARMATDRGLAPFSTTISFSWISWFSYCTFTSASRITVSGSPVNVHSCTGDLLSWTSPHDWSHTFFGTIVTFAPCQLPWSKDDLQFWHQQQSNECTYCSVQKHYGTCRTHVHWIHRRVLLGYNCDRRSTAIFPRSLPWTACTRVDLGGSSTSFTDVRTPTTHSKMTFLLTFTATMSSGRARKRVTSVSTSVATGADGGRCGVNFPEVSCLSWHHGTLSLCCLMQSVHFQRLTKCQFRFSSCRWSWLYLVVATIWSRICWSMRSSVPKLQTATWDHSWAANWLDGSPDSGLICRKICLSNVGLGSWWKYALSFLTAVL